MANDVKIDIQSVNRTKAGWEGAIKDAVAGAQKIEQSVDKIESDITGTADKIGHTGEQAAKMAINLLQAFGLSGEKAKVLEGILRQVDDGFDALGKAAYLASTANAAVAASNTTVATTGGLAITAMRGLTAAMIANPITAILVGLGAAAAAVMVAFDQWPKATENVEAMNEKLQKQKELVDAIEGAAKKRFNTSSESEKLEERAAQKLALKRIAEIDSVTVAEITSRHARERLESLKAEQGAHETKLRLLSAQLAQLEKARVEQHLTETNSVAGLHNAQKMREVEAEINKETRTRLDYEKQINNARAQAEAAQDRALALPEEQRKKELEHLEKVKKSEEELRVKREKAAAQRIKDEDDYATAIIEMREENLKAIEEEEKERKKKKEKKDKEEKETGPEFVGLEQLTKNIQLAALKPTKAEKIAEETKTVLEETKEVLAGIKRVSEESKVAEESIAVSSKATAEKIGTVGRLA